MTLALLEAAQREMLLFCGFWLLVGGIDDLLIDLLWLVRTAYRRLHYYRQQPPLRSDQIAPADRPGLLAVFVPTWREANIIEAMLAECLKAWQNSGADFRVHVGCYHNDAKGIAATMRAAAQSSQIRIALVPHDGPTSKADCLNHIWQKMIAEELAIGRKVKAVLLHDAEDCVHADEPRIIDRLIEKNAAVQLPVIPIRVAGSAWISGHYCDEFAEAHGKSMVVREAIGAALPLAGVGCAIDRTLLGRIALQNGGRPFDGGSLTEDYELGIRIGGMGHRAIMARIFDTHGQLVGTRACFPDTLDAAVRQKSRWLTGIAFAGWDRLGWKGSIAEKWMRLHDRRSILAAIVLLVAYASIILTTALWLAEVSGFSHARGLPGYLKTILAINALVMLWRWSVRAAFVHHIYGWREALRSIPRGIIANIIAIMAARRAAMAYLQHCFGKPLVWDCTEHRHLPAR